MTQDLFVLIGIVTVFLTISTISFVLDKKRQELLPNGN